MGDPFGSVPGVGRVIVAFDILPWNQWQLCPNFFSLSPFFFCFSLGITGQEIAHQFFRHVEIDFL